MGIREDTLVALPGGGSGEDPSKSLALLLKAQYLSREFNDVLASTELREHEIIGIAGAMSTRFISLILSTDEQIQDEAPVSSKQLIEERITIKKRILSDPNAMVFAIQDAYLYAFGLCRQSLNRQSRTEGVAISTASIQSSSKSGADIGVSQSIMSKLGMGSYNVAYVPKGK